MSSNDFDYEPPVTTGLYHKFENGKEYLLRLASPTVIFNTEYQGQVSEKYAWLVWNVQEKSAHIMQLPVSVYRTIRKFAKDPEYGDPREYTLKITRTGEKLETKYDVIPSPNKVPLSELAPEAAAELAKIDLLDAVSKGKGVSNVEFLSGNTKREPVPTADNLVTETAGPGPEDTVGSDGSW